MTVVERVFDITTDRLGEKFMFLAPFFTCIRLTTLYRGTTGESSTEIIYILLFLICSIK
jgi:hypothetical protein